MELELQGYLSASQSQGSKRHESSTSHVAYICYRSMGASRSLRKLHDLFNDPVAYRNFCQKHAIQHSDKPPSKYISTIETWSKIWRWQERVKEWEQHLQIERSRLFQESRLEERDRRKMILDAMASKLAKSIKSVPHDNVNDVKQLFLAFKIYMDQSRHEHHDLQPEISNVSEKQGVQVNFITEAIPDSMVQARLETLGLADLVEQQRE